MKFDSAFIFILVIALSPITSMAREFYGHSHRLDPLLGNRMMYGYSYVMCENDITRSASIQGQANNQRADIGNGNNFPSSQIIVEGEFALTCDDSAAKAGNAYLAFPSHVTEALKAGSTPSKYDQGLLIQLSLGDTYFTQVVDCFASSTPPSHLLSCKVKNIDGQMLTVNTVFYQYE